MSKLHCPYNGKCEICDLPDCTASQSEALAYYSYEEWLTRTRYSRSFHEAIRKVRKVYKYGMRLRGFSIGCQPMKGIIERQDDAEGKYHDILLYSRKLTDKECAEFELDYLGEVKR